MSLTVRPLPFIHSPDATGSGERASESQDGPGIADADDDLEAETVKAGASADGSLEPTAKERELQAKLMETTDRMMRIAADFDNTRKRWEKERQETRAYAITEFARDLLPVIDAFDNAMNAIEQSAGSFETEEGKRRLM